MMGHHHYRPRYCSYSMYCCILLSLLARSTVRRPRSPNSNPLFTHSNEPLNSCVLCHHFLDWGFTFFLTINHVICSFILDHIGSSLTSLKTFWVRLPLSSLALQPGLLFFECLDIVPQVPQLCVGALSLEKNGYIYIYICIYYYILYILHMRQWKTGPAGSRFRLERVDLLSESFCNENSSFSCQDDDGRIPQTARIQTELGSNTTAADRKSAAWVISCALQAKCEVGWTSPLGCNPLGKVARTQELPPVSSGSWASAIWWICLVSTGEKSYQHRTALRTQERMHTYTNTHAQTPTGRTF